MMSDSFQSGGGGGENGAVKNHSIEPAAFIDSAQLVGSHARYVRVLLAARRKTAKLAVTS